MKCYKDDSELETVYQSRTCAAKLGDEEFETTEELAASLYPNTTMIETRLFVETASSETVEVQIVDLNGKLVYSVQNVPVRQEVLLGSELKSGVYYVKVIDKLNVKVIKLVKTELE